MSDMKIIRSESIPIDSLDDLTTVYKDLASVRRKDGAALVQCAQFLPPNSGFPESKTKFHKPKTVSFLKTSRAISDNQEFLQIDPNGEHPKVVYRHPGRVNAPEGIMTPQEVCNEIELVFESRMKSQTRLTIESKYHANVLLKAGPPLSDCNTLIYGVTMPLRLVSLGKSVFEIILGDWGLGWSSLLIAGASCLFIIIAPDSTTAFEDAIKTAFGIKKATCSQFLRHLGIFPSLSFLRHHNIEFSLMQQRVGDVAIIFPGTYCYGIETGTSYSENISWATDDWDPARVEYKNCHSTCGAIDVIVRPKKRRCNQRKSTVQSTTTDIHQMTGASWEISNLGPDTGYSLQLPEIEQDYEDNHGSTSSEELEVDQRPKRQRIINHPFELLPPEREFSRTPESTRMLSQRTRHVLTNNIPAPFTDREGSEVSTNERLHERVENFLERSEREGSAEEKESVKVIRRYWARLRDQQAQRTRSLRDG